ncbi:hypothetical protein LR48_Vigan07g144400 [Vigna angularis]|uniref:Uncharacterized protein n=1 Tax=Phaseolus angularis TaxID=3914 RepID=A0A0L9UXZ4_PHAAN|nr:hypothetical protein LR48_Vigan07g144400 [Vigna angularis]
MSHRCRKPRLSSPRTPPLSPLLRRALSPYPSALKTNKQFRNTVQGGATNPFEGSGELKSMSSNGLTLSKKEVDLVEEGGVDVIGGFAFDVEDGGVVLGFSEEWRGGDRVWRRGGRRCATAKGGERSGKRRKLKMPPHSLLPPYFPSSSCLHHASLSSPNFKFKFNHLQLSQRTLWLPLSRISPETYHSQQPKHKLKIDKGEKESPSVAVSKDDDAAVGNGSDGAWVCCQRQDQKRWWRGGWVAVVNGGQLGRRSPENVGERRESLAKAPVVCDGSRWQPTSLATPQVEHEMFAVTRSLLLFACQWFCVSMGVLCVSIGAPCVSIGAAPLILFVAPSMGERVKVKMESECGKQRHGGEGKRKNNQTFSEKTKENLSKIKRQCSRPRAYRLATSGRFLVGLRKNATCCLAGSIGSTPLLPPSFSLRRLVCLCVSGIRSAALLGFVALLCSGSWLASRCTPQLEVRLAGGAPHLEVRQGLEPQFEVRFAGGGSRIWKCGKVHNRTSKCGFAGMHAAVRSAANTTPDFEWRGCRTRTSLQETTVNDLMRRDIPDERLVPPVRRRRSAEQGLLGGMRRVIRMLQGMLTCRDVTEGTIAYQRTTETLEVARRSVEEYESSTRRGGRHVRGRASFS